MLTSAAYMQRGESSENGLLNDPENRLHWRHAPARLEAEVIRDSMLVAGRSIDRQMSGPGSLEENCRRRSIYFTVKHSKPIPFLQLLNAPYSTNSVGERVMSIGPAQALAMMNSPVVRDMAEAFARRLDSADKKNLPSLINDAYQIALSRAPSKEEFEGMSRLIESLASSYGDASDASERAIVDFCQILFCSNEFVFVD